MHGDAGVGEVIETESIPGGGTLPGVGFASVGLGIAGDHADALRSGAGGHAPIIARVVEGRTELDLRTVDPADDHAVAAALAAL